MNELLEQIVKGIVNNPDEVVVVQRESIDFPGLIILEVAVADSDKGILIGRRGRTINAIRDLITISAIRNNKRVKVLVKDDAERAPRTTERSENRPERAEQQAPQQQEEQNFNVADNAGEEDDIFNDEI